MPEPQVSPQSLTTRIYRFGGQRSRWRHPNPRLEAEVAVKIRNLNLSEFGTADRRKGYTRYNSSQITGSEAVTGLLEQQFITPDAKHEIFVTPTKIYADDGSTRKDITGSVSLSGDANDLTTFEFLLDTVVATNAKDPPWIWVGNFATPTTAAALTVTAANMTRVEDFAVIENLLIALGTTEGGDIHPTRVRWSDINEALLTPNIGSWPTENRHEIDEGTEKIVGGVGNFGRLLIFKRDGMYPGFFNFQTGFVEFQQEEPKLGFRPVSRTSIVKRPEFVWIIAEDGAYVVDPSLNVSKVTDDIQDEWESLNQGRLEYAVSSVLVNQRQVKTLLSSENNTSGHDLVLLWDWESGNLMIDELKDNMSYISNRKNSDVKEVTWYGGTTVGYVFDGTGTTDDDTVGIDWEYFSAPNDLGMPNVTKIIKNVTVWYKDVEAGAQNIVIEVVRDQGVRSSRTKTMTFGTDLSYDAGILYDSGISWPGGANKKARFFVNRNAENISIRLTGDEDVNLHGYSVEFIPTEPIAETRTGEVQQRSYSLTN